MPVEWLFHKMSRYYVGFKMKLITNQNDDFSISFMNGYFLIDFTTGNDIIRKVRPYFISGFTNGSYSLDPYYKVKVILEIE